MSFFFQTCMKCYKNVTDKNEYAMHKDGWCKQALELRKEKERKELEKSKIQDAEIIEEKQESTPNLQEMGKEEKQEALDELRETLNQCDDDHLKRLAKDKKIRIGRKGRKRLIEDLFEVLRA